MKTVTVDVKWDKEILLSQEVLDVLKGSKKVALFASVQFLELDSVRGQLQEIGAEVLVTKAKRCHVSGQVLGCDVYCDAYQEDIISEADSVLYIGDGMFHPKALLLAQMFNNVKDIIIWDPVNSAMKILTANDIAAHVQKLKANLKRYLAASAVGILVSVKPGQQFLDLAVGLRKDLIKQGKKAYVFVDDVIDIGYFEDYPFVDVWVSTACPRIGFDDSLNCPKALLNYREAVDAVHVLEKLD